MKRGRNRKHKRTPREHKYERVPCPECNRSLYMKKGKKPKCPYCGSATWTLKKRKVHVIKTGPDFMDASIITPSGVINE